MLGLIEKRASNTRRPEWLGEHSVPPKRIGQRRRRSARPTG